MRRQAPWIGAALLLTAAFIAPSGALASGDSWTPFPAPQTESAAERAAARKAGRPAAAAPSAVPALKPAAAPATTAIKPLVRPVAPATVTPVQAGRPAPAAPASALAVRPVAAPKAAPAGAPVPLLPAVEARPDSTRQDIVTVASGTVAGSYIKFAGDIAFVLNGREDLRVMPVLSAGAMQNAGDLLLLDNIDVGFVRSDVVEAVMEKPEIAGLGRRLVYITKLFADEVHILTTRDITDVRALAGRRVNMDLPDSGGNFTGRRIFARLGIDAVISNHDQLTAYDLLRKGALEAVLHMVTKPNHVIRDLPRDERFHLIGIPYDERIREFYLPATLRSQDYPNLIGEGHEVQTVAGDSLLATVDWPEGSERYARVAKFVHALFSNFRDLQTPARQPKWQEVNLSASVPGWVRFKAAEEWLQRNLPEPVGRPPVIGLGGTFSRGGAVLAAPAATGSRINGGAEYEELLRNFKDWAREGQR